jgi:enoyl-CoA hydratase
MSEVLTDRRGRVLVITINRPHRRNAIDCEAAIGIAGAMELLDSDGELRVGVITGAGGWFSSGMDLKAFHASGQRPHVSGRGFAGIVELPPRKPLVAAIEGFALAGGLEIALACDLIVAARGAKLGVPEVKRGLVAAGGALIRLGDSLPSPIVMELALTGEPMLAERAAELGLVGTLVEPGQALDRAVELAERVAANAPLATVASKAVIRAAPRWPLDELWPRQRAIADPVIASDDAREGARAFSEQRDPVWRGR